MRIEFSEHSLDQLRIRTRITKQMILETIDQPDQVLNSYRARRLYLRHYHSDTLEVVAKEEDNKLIIITAYIVGQEL